MAGSFKKRITETVALDYLVYVPKPSAKSGKEKLPAILFLHGSGERGTNVWDVARHGPPRLLKEGKEFPFIVISPQCPPGEQWETEALAAFAGEMKKRYPIDPDRFYLTGLSMGGTGSWNLALHHPTLFAAAVPICGRADTNGLPFLPSETLTNLTRLPIWAFHGAKDGETPVSRSVIMVDALKEMGGNANLTIYPDAAHDSWSQTYANPDLYTWFLSHNRKINHYTGRLE